MKKYPYYLGKSKYKCDDELLYIRVYNEKPFIDENGKERLSTKLDIPLSEVLLIPTEGVIEVYSKVDIGDHHKNETSIIAKSKIRSRWNGGEYRGVMLRED